MFRLMQNHRASVTVFVTMLLIPSLIITGFMVDMARYKGGFQEIQNALQLEGSAVLGKYDGLLHDIYGLFAVTQNREVLEGVERYFDASFNPTGYGDGVTVSGEDGAFNPYGGAKREITWETLPESSLRNGVVMQNQMADYMKYRAAVSLIGAGNVPGALESAEKLENLQKDSAFLNMKAKLDKTMGKVGAQCREFYDKTLALESYYKGKEEAAAFTTMRGAAGEISACYTKIEELQEREPEDEEEAESIEEEIEALYRKIEGIAKKASTTQKKDAEDLKKAYTPYFEQPISFDPFSGVDGDIEDLAKAIDEDFKKAREQYNDLKTNYLPSASTELTSAMQEELDVYEALLNDESFTDLAADIYTNQELLDAVCANIRAASYGGTPFSVVAEDAEAHSQSGLSGSTVSGSKRWKLAHASNPELMKVLDDWAAQSKTYTQAEQDAKKSQRENLEKAMEEQLEEQKDTETKKGASEIPLGIYQAQASQRSALDAGKNLDSKGAGLTEEVTGNVSGMSSNGFSEFSGIMGGLGKIANDAINKLLVTEYGVQMFSCAATGNTAKAKDKSPDTTMSGIPLDPKVNYLYQSEMEYLFAGNRQAEANLLAAGGSIYGIQFVLNFAATYTDKDLNAAIKVAGTAIGAGYPPTVIAATLVLRGAVAGVESANDLYVLTNGGEIPLVKNSLQCSLDGLGTGGAKGYIMMQYEDYMRLLLLLFIDGNTITKRATDLIELNITNYGGGVGSADGLFLLEESHTAVMLKGTIQTNFLFNATPFTGAKDPTGGLSHTITLHRGY